MKQGLARFCIAGGSNGRRQRFRGKHPVQIMTLEQVVSRDPDIVSGALVFKGTRVPVQTLIDYLKSGETLDRFLDGFPTVSREQAEAYLELTLGEAEDHA